MGKLIGKALLLAMSGIALVIAAGLLGPVHPVFDTVANFRLHLSAGLVGLALLWSLGGNRAGSAVFLAAGLAGLALSAPGLPLGMHRAHAGADEPQYTAYVKNLFWNNPVPEAVLAQIDRHDPDLLLLTEVSERWSPVLAKLASRYPYRFNCAEWRTVGGSVILAKFPLHNDATFCGDYASLGLTHGEIGGKRVALGIVHLRWPWPANGPRQIDELQPVLAGIGENALVAGDYNSTTWSHSTARFHAAGGLTGVWGIGPSWGPVWSRNGERHQWPGRLGLPIDNAAYKGAVRVVDWQRLPHAGSDHMGLLLRFVVR